MSYEPGTYIDLAYLNTKPVIEAQFQGVELVEVGTRFMFLNAAFA